VLKGQMKKINYKKIVSFVLWIFAISGLITSWSFAAKKQESVKINHVSIDILNPSENEFINEADVKTFFEERNDKLIDNEVKNIDITSLEKALNSNPAVENADISYDINGDMKISVKQRRPMVRVFNFNGESYYIDSLSKLMPLSFKSTGRVLVANGYIFEPYARRYNYSVDQIAKNENFKAVSVLDDVYEISKAIYSDSLLTNLIHQIYVTPDRNFILTPIVGQQSILLGPNEDLNIKLNKLKLFYTEGLNKTDSWNKYSTINLKFKNLVVCTKK
jgi:cell division protein FtsQ